MVLKDPRFESCERIFIIDLQIKSLDILLKCTKLFKLIFQADKLLYGEYEKSNFWNHVQKISMTI